MNKPKKILLIGSSGYLGSKIIDKLQSKYDITSLNRDDIKDFPLLKKKIKGTVFDIFINAIVQYEFKDISTLIESNFYLGFKIYDIIDKSDNFKLFQFGSFYSKSFKTSQQDSYLLSKENLMNYSKLLNFYEKTNIFYLQLEHLIGPGESIKKFNGWLKYNLLNDIDIDLESCNHYFDFIYINDILNLIDLLITTNRYKNEFKFFEVGSGKATFLKSFVLDLKTKLNSKSKITFSDKGSLNTYKNKSSVANISELVDLGWLPEYGINDIIDNL
jgi:nucleoside-diphosphate-sugar epimerase